MPQAMIQTAESEKYLPPLFRRNIRSRYPALPVSSLCSLAGCAEEIFQRRCPDGRTPQAGERQDGGEKEPKEGLPEGLEMYFKEKNMPLRVESYELEEIEGREAYEGKKGDKYMPFLEEALARGDDVIVRYRKSEGSLQYGLVESVDKAGPQGRRENKTIRILEVKPDEPSRHVVFSRGKLKKAISGERGGFLVVADDLAF